MKKAAQWLSIALTPTMLLACAPAGQAQGTPSPAASPSRPQDPRPPLPYGSEDVSFENPRDGTRIAGTLTVPGSEGRFPAVLLVSGSGAHDRNSSAAGHRPFLVIADYLTRSGIAVLRVDDRGVGGTTGTAADATVQDLTDDVGAGIAFLRSHPLIDPLGVGIIGHSEGGIIGASVAASRSDVAFLVMLAGPAVSGRQVLLEQTRAQMAASGGGPINERIAVLQIMIDVSLSMPATTGMRQALTILGERIDDEVARRPADEGQRIRAIWSAAPQQQIVQNLTTMRSVWFQSQLDYDPIDALRALRVPALALYGGRDLQVLADQNAPVLREAWQEHANATVQVVPDVNHFFQQAETGLPAEYATIEETISPSVLQLVGNWIQEQLTPR